MVSLNYRKNANIICTVFI